MGSHWKLETRTVALEPAWRLGEGESWRLGGAPDSTLALLPESAFVPQLPPPPLEPIGDMPVVTGVGLPWRTWTRITENGRTFREQFRAGSLGDSLRSERNAPLPLLLDHGQNPGVGLLPLGRLQVWEDEIGLRFEAALLPTSYSTNVAAAVRHGLMGASVRFGVLDANVNRNPGRSRANPEGYETREITKARLVELSLVVSPAYPKTSAEIVNNGRL